MSASALIFGGSAVALVVLFTSKPLLGALLALAVLLVAFAEGSYRLFQDRPEKPMSIGELQRFAEAVRYGAFDREPYGTGIDEDDPERAA